MPDQPPSTRARFRKKLEGHMRLVEELGGAIERRCDDTGSSAPPELAAYTNTASVADGLRRAVPLLGDMGIEMEVVDVSNEDVDAALEILHTCICLEASKACGLAQPSSVLCHLEVESNRRALPGTEVTALSRRVDDGSCVCIFKYERPREP